MDSKQILDKVVARLRGIGYRLSGDDSDLADIWEEIKEQVQNEPSFFWSAYCEAIECYAYGVINSLTAEELAADLAYANAAGSLATTRTGAIPALPTENEIQNCLTRTRTLI